MPPELAKIHKEPLTKGGHAACRRGVYGEHERDLKHTLYARRKLARYGYLKGKEGGESAGFDASLVGWSPPRTPREVDRTVLYQEIAFRTASDPGQLPETTVKMGELQA